MTPSLGVPTSDTNSCALAGSYCEANLIPSFVGFNTHNTSSNLVGFAGIMGVFVFKEFYIF